MIVTCERCATQFQLDDTRVPEKGVRVRCSRCKHAFAVLRPAPVPPSTGPEDEESDWEFSEDLPSDPASRRAGGDAAASVVDDLLGGAESAASSRIGGLDPLAPSGLELGDEPPLASPSSLTTPAAPTAKPPEPEASPLHDEPTPGKADATPSGMDLASGESRVEAPPEPTADVDPLDALAGELESELADDLTGGVFESDPEPRTNELSPADWDVLADTDGGLGSRANRVLDVDPGDLVDDRPRWQTALEGMGQIAGAIAVALLFALGLRGGLLPAPAVSSGPPLGVHGDSPPDAEFDQVSGRFVDHSAAGPVYVVSGRLHNTGSRPVSAGSLAVVVLDAEGRRLGPPTPVGVPFSAAILREGDLEDPQRISPPLRPGESRAVEAALGPLPSGAQRLALVSVEAPTGGTAAATTPPAATAAVNQAGATDAPTGRTEPSDPSNPPAAPAP